MFQFAKFEFGLFVRIILAVACRSNPAGSWADGIGAIISQTPIRTADIAPFRRVTAADNPRVSTVAAILQDWPLLFDCAFGTPQMESDDLITHDDFVRLRVGRTSTCLLRRINSRHAATIK